jgi:GxxExxY protein
LIRKPGKQETEKNGPGTRSVDRANHWRGDRGAPAPRAGFSRIGYEKALIIELKKRGMAVQDQMEVIITYDGNEVGRHRLDLFVEDTIVVDLKAIKNLEDIHFAVVRSQLKAVDRKHGLLLNFAKTTLEPKRVIAS